MRRNSGDEELRKLWKAVVKSGGDDASLIERYLNLLRRHEDPEKAAEEDRRRERNALEDAKSLVRQEYHDSVRSHVESILNDIRSGEIADREALLDRVSEESSDNHWTIYTAASQQALWASENADHGLEERLVSLDDHDTVPWGSLAGWAFYADLLDELGREIDVNDDSEWPRNCSVCGQSTTEWVDCSSPRCEARICDSCDVRTWEDDDGVEHTIEEPACPEHRLRVEELEAE